MAADPTPIRDRDPNVVVLDALQNLITGQGGAKDSRAPGNRRFRYVKRTPQDLEELYRSTWLGGQVVDIPAFEMTRCRREFLIEDEKTTKKIEADSRRLMLWEKFQEAIKWADLYGGGALLLGLDGTGELDEPLDLNRVKEGSLRFIHALDARTLLPNGGLDTQLVYDPTSAQFMQPEFYSIAAARMDWVHHSRIIRFPGVSLPWLEMQRTLWWGGSVVERMYDAIADADAVVGGVIHLLKEASVDVIGIKGLMGLLRTEEGTETIRKRIQLSDTMKSIYNSIVKDADEDYAQKQNALVQGMAGLVEQYLVIVAAASGIPVTRLLGTSAKGLSATGEGDLRNFYDMIDSRRQTYLRPRIDALDQVFLRSVLGTIPEDGIPWEFGSLWQMDETQRAAVDKSDAETARIYYDIGVINELNIAQTLHQDGKWNVTAQEVEEARKFVEADEPDADPAPDPDKPAGPKGENENDDPPKDPEPEPDE